MSYTVKPLSAEDAARADKTFGVKPALLEFNPGKCLLPPHHAKIAQQVIDAPVREDDVWLISFPRTGSTWCQEMVWLMSNNLDFYTARNTIQQIRAPLIEMSTFLFGLKDFFEAGMIDNSVELINSVPSPRFIRSHLPLPLLPTQLDKIKPKVIYICRNPKDTCVSYYHYCKLFHNIQIPFEEFCDQFLQNVTPLGSIFTHYFGFWNKRHETNILFLKYEDAKRDLRGTLKKIADFLDKSFTEQEYDKLCDFLSFQKMKGHKGCNLDGLFDKMFGKDGTKREEAVFIRKGQVGDWENHMSEEMSKRFDVWIEENTKGTGLTFD